MPIKTLYPILQTTDPDYIPNVDDADLCDEEEHYTYNTTPLQNATEMAVRLGIGNEALAKLLTCYNRDLDLTSKTDIVTEGKIRSQKKLLFENACNKKRGMDVYGIYFDGKKDKTLVLNHNNL